MQISQPMLQLLLYKKAQNEQTQIQTQEASTEANTVVANNAILTNTTPTSEDYKTANEFATQSCNRTTIQNLCDNEKIIKTQSITISSLSDTQIRQIKQTIYDLHHRTTGSGGSDGGNSGSDETPPSTPVTPPSTPTTPGAGNITFMRDFSNVDGMFTYINTINSSVNKSTGITDEQLWELTQRDDWEENNYHFFGKLNESFNHIDANGDNKLSYDEICTFIGDEMNLSEYNSQVEQYSNYLQSLFERMTPAEKLAFTIEKAREYLTSIGLTEQLAALNRLYAEGKLGFADLNPGETYDENTGGWTLGSYQYLEDTLTGNWATDDLYDWNRDGIITEAENINEGYYAGIFLDEYYYCERPQTKWYDLVATFIHELTHATASFHPADETQWGEYVAYQTEEDYLDSIGHSQWSGTSEASDITSHINTYYEDEPVPTFTWSTYGTYA